MLRTYLLLLSFSLLLSATTLGELFDALKSHSQTKADEVLIVKSEVAQKSAYANLYPKIDIFASYDNYSTPTALLPVSPNTLVALVSDPTKPNQPSSYNIYKAGAKFSMPIFIKSIFTFAAQAEALKRSAQAKKHINILKNEAIIVGADANFLYLQALQEALDAKDKSLLETRKTIQIKVDTGRVARSALYKIDTNMNQVAIAKNNIALQKTQIQSTIKALTGITLSTPIALQSTKQISAEVLASLKPLEQKIGADRLALRAQKEKFYPSVIAHGSYAYSRANAYNNGNTINEKYGNVGVSVNIPLLDISQDASVELSKVALLQDTREYEKQKDVLLAQANQLQESLSLYQHSLDLQNRDIKNKEKLLLIAKTSFTTGRMTTEDYLRYEDDLVSAKADFHKTKAQIWQAKMQLAIIYANNIEEIVQ